MKRTGLLLCAMFVCVVASFGQGARNIKINEVQTKNTKGLIDSYGERNAWVELANTSYSTYDVRGMYIATDRKVLDKNLTVPQRVAMMSCIPNDDEQTKLTARKHIVLFLNSNPSKGTQHLTAKADENKPLWIALYDGNGIDIIDSITVPVLQENQSYAREKDGAAEWSVKSLDYTTPGIENYVHVNETKIAKLKREDPHGFGITILSMGIVFSCLALLYIFFRLLGMFMSHKEALAKASKIQPIKTAVKTGEILAETGHKTKVMLKDGMQTGGIDKEIYIAVIAMALKQYEDDVHDIESNVITIKPRHTYWNVLPEEPIMP